MTTDHEEHSTILTSKGTRLEIWWDDDQRFYAGRIILIRKHREKRWKIRYDDGETEWVDLRQELYHILKEQETPSPEDLDTAAATTIVRNDTDDVHVGSLVSVWWEYYKQYFPGVVKRINPSRSKPFFVHYDDDDARWEDLSQVKFFLRGTQCDL